MSGICKRCGSDYYVDAYYFCYDCRLKNFEEEKKHRYIIIRNENLSGEAAICFPFSKRTTFESTDDDKYLKEGEIVYSEGKFFIDFDDVDCPFEKGVVYKVVD